MNTLEATLGKRRANFGVGGRHAARVVFGRIGDDKIKGDREHL